MPPEKQEKWGAKVDWQAIAGQSPAAWKAFVDWYSKEKPAVFIHADRWVDEITREDLKEFVIERFPRMGMGWHLYTLLEVGQMTDLFKYINEIILEELKSSLA